MSYLIYDRTNPSSPPFTTTRLYLPQDLDRGRDTMVIYSYKEGEGVGQHPNANRGASIINFSTGNADAHCEDGEDFESLHGALMLIAWMILAPVGIYYIR